MIVALCLTTDKINALPAEHTERDFAVYSLITNEKDMKKCHLIGKRLLPSVERRIKTRKLTGDNPQNNKEMKKIMELNKFKDKDILVSDSKSVISILKGDYNNGAFRDYAWASCASGALDIRPTGVWNGITDWRLATAKEKAKFKTEIDIHRKKAERELEVIVELQKIIQ